MGFGAGIHSCLGNMLARIESTIAIPRFVRRFPKLKLANEPVWDYDYANTIRGLKTFRVAIHS